MTTRVGPVRRDVRVLWRRTLDGAVLLPPAGEAVRLNSTAAAVWQLLDCRRTLEDLVVALVESTDGSEEVIAHDLGPLVRRLVDDGLAIELP